MDHYWIWAFILFVLGIGLAVMEVFFPSAGVLAFLVGGRPDLGGRDGLPAGRLDRHRGRWPRSSAACRRCSSWAFGTGQKREWGSGYY